MTRTNGPSEAQSPGGCQLLESSCIGKEPWCRYFRRHAKSSAFALRRYRWQLRVHAKALALRFWPGLRRFHRPNGDEIGCGVPVVSCLQAAPMATELAAGDTVRVRSREEIDRTLDAKGCRGGCKFLEPMARYCGQEMRVLRRLEHFYDEAKGRLLRCKNVVLLEGAHCDGMGHPDTRGCDRMCYFFWRTEWLERIKKSEGE